MIFQDLYKHFTETSEISILATGGAFWRNPLEAPTEDPYIVYTRVEERENDVRNVHTIQVVSFAKSMNDLDALTEAIKESFRNTTQIGNGNYYMIQIVSQADSDRKLENGYYFNVLNLYLKETL